jgi:molybdopterin molybdotransferase
VDRVDVVNLRDPAAPVLGWETARERAGSAGPLPVAQVPLPEAGGLVLADALRARCDLPAFDCAAMDGWAVSGSGPWRLREGRGLAGSVPAPLAPGEATGIATGAWLPAGSTAVLRREHGEVDGTGTLTGVVPEGGDIRPRGQECRTGDELLPAGWEVTPAVLGLAAAGGYDQLPVIRRARVELLLLGDELLVSGLPRKGRVRDALGPLLPGWLRALGAAVPAARYVEDTVPALHAALAASTADVVVTTGGTARGPVDHLHDVLAALSADLLVDGVEVRPGHPMLLARRGPSRYLVGLPGNPLAAVSGVLTLLEPLLRSLHGRAQTPRATVRPTEPVTGHPRDTRLVPVRGRRPLHFAGPAMLRGFALADGMAVIPPGGAPAGTELTLLPVPWAPSPDKPDEPGEQGGRA